jgi:hypothetical protein
MFAWHDPAQNKPPMNTDRDHHNTSRLTSTFASISKIIRAWTKASAFNDLDFGCVEAKLAITKNPAPLPARIKTGAHLHQLVQVRDGASQS